ncbi:hypothetical protein ACA910_007813 [Epithemia clementina (nom. ined.)]
MKNMRKAYELMVIGCGFIFLSVSRREATASFVAVPGEPTKSLTAAASPSSWAQQLANNKNHEVTWSLLSSSSSSLSSSPPLFRRRSTRLYGDGNPPPFGSWQPPTPPAPAPTVPSTTSTTTTAWPSPTSTPALADGNPPPFGDWGKKPVAAPPTAPTTIMDGNPPRFSSWGMSAAPSPSPAWSAPQPAAAPASTFVATSSGNNNNNNDRLAALIASQEATVESIAKAIPTLETKPDLSWSLGEATIGSNPCIIDARDAPGPANIAWLASVTIPNTLSSLTIFNGPLTNVPHLLSRCYHDVKQQELQVVLDFRPRAYGAYELVDAQGNYPGPEQLGRKAFEYSAARMDFFNQFATSALQAELNHWTRSFQGAVPTSIQPTNLDLLTGSPLAIALTMPANDHNIQVALELRQVAVQAWLRWATNVSGAHNHRPGAPINAQYVYDAKFRQNAYLALRKYYSHIFNPADDGAALAVAESGPLDEAYVGGGS